MLTLNVGFSRKVGEANYGSRGASLHLELELDSRLIEQPDKLQDRIRRLYAMARQAVEEELRGQKEQQVVLIEDQKSSLEADKAVLEKAGDLAAILTNLEAHDVLFIDEIHRLSPVVEEILYPAMEDYQLDIMIGDGPSARSIKLDLPPFTLVGATTRAGLLTSPLRDRFGIVHRLEFYSAEDLCRIILRSAGLLKIQLEAEGAHEIASRSRGTPRIANRLLRRARDYAEVKADGVISAAVAKAALDMLKVDRSGLDHMDRRLILALIEKFEGGPVGVESLSAAIGEERGTIEDVIEPYLIQQGFMMRTPRGRVVTSRAYLHLGLKNSSQKAGQAHGQSEIDL